MTERERDTSMSTLISGIVGDAQELVRQEIALARQEIREYVPALGQQLDKTLHDRGMATSHPSYTSHQRNLTPSTAPNASMSAGAARAGFDSPPETT